MISFLNETFESTQETWTCLSLHVPLKAAVQKSEQTEYQRCHSKDKMLSGQISMSHQFYSRQPYPADWRAMHQVTFVLQRLAEWKLQCIEHSTRRSGKHDPTGVRKGKLREGWVYCRQCPLDDRFLWYHSNNGEHMAHSKKKNYRKTILWQSLKKLHSVASCQ